MHKTKGHSGGGCLSKFIKLLVAIALIAVIGVFVTGNDKDSDKAEPEKTKQSNKTKKRRKIERTNNDRKDDKPSRFRTEQAIKEEKPKEVEWGDIYNHEATIYDLALSPNGYILASAGDDGHICFWNIKDKKFLFSTPRHKGSLWCCAFSPDGSKLVSGDYEGYIHIWDINTQQLICPPVRHGNSVVSVAFSHDGTKIATNACEDDYIRIWDSSNLEPIREVLITVRFEPTNHARVIFSSFLRLKQA